MVLMDVQRRSQVGRSTLRPRLAALAGLALLAASPGWAAAPAGLQEANIGSPGTPGSVVDNGDGTWTITGSGNQFDGNTQDQLYFLYKLVNGDGSVQFNLMAQGSPGSQYIGLMVRGSTNPGALFAGPIMATGAVNWLRRTTPDVAAVRDSGDSSKYRYPKYMMVQRVGNSVQGFESDDGKLWDTVKPAVTLALDATALLGVAVSSRSSSPITAQVSGVQVSEGVVAVTGLESAATNNVAFMAWEPVGTAVGYNIYRGDKGTTLDKMKLLNATAPTTDPYYLDNAASPTPLKGLSYVVVPVFKAADGKLFEGPAVRAR